MKYCIIFDMDGVIIDSEPFHTACEKEIFRLLGISVSDEEHNSYIGATDETMWSRIGEKHQLQLSIPEIIQLKKSIYMEYLRREVLIKPVSYLRELIIDLHKSNFLLAVASSSPYEQIDFILGTIGIKQYFHSIVSGEDVKEGKPHPEIFLKVAGMTGVNPGSCVVIEDSFNGVTAAKNAGMKCIGFINQNSGKQDLSKADLVVSSAKEISVEIIKYLLGIRENSAGRNQ